MLRKLSLITLTLWLSGCASTSEPEEKTAMVSTPETPVIDSIIEMPVVSGQQISANTAQLIQGANLNLEADDAELLGEGGYAAFQGYSMTDENGLPLYADKEIPLSKQQALLQRGLVISNRGRIVPSSPAVCGFALIEPIDNFTQLNDERPSFYRMPFLKIADEKALRKAREEIEQKVLLDVRHLTADQLKRSLSAAMSNIRVSLLITDKHLDLFTELDKPRAYQLTSRHDGYEKVRQVTGFQEHIIARSSPLTICQELTYGAMVGRGSAYQKQKQYSDLELIDQLPADADFNQLAKQKKLMPKGHYMSYNGEQKPVIDRCQLQLSAADRKLCRDHANDVMSEKNKDRKVIIGGNRAPNI